MIERPLAKGLAVDLEGALDLEAGEAVLQAVQARQPLPALLVLNFTAAGPISTAGLGGILWAVRLVTRAGGRVAAYGLSDHYRKVFYVMGLTQYICIVASEADLHDEEADSPLNA